MRKLIKIKKVLIFCGQREHYVNIYEDFINQRGLKSCKISKTSTTIKGQSIACLHVVT
uniref:Uncharacterized protein n=1 Tax=Ciona intestinalis TaxID=7719 RepID=H2XQE1_CIOIN